MISQPLNRREFLEVAAITAGASILPATLTAANPVRPSREKPARIPLGFSLYGMRSLETNHALNVCADVGYDAVELVANADWPCDPVMLSKAARRDIRRQLGDLNLKLPALMENLVVFADGDSHRKNLDRLKAAGELGHELSPTVPPVLETILGGKPAQWDEVKGQMAEGLRDWAKAAEASQTVVAVKPHVGGALHTPAGAKWLVDEVASPWIRLAYDFSHFQLRDFDLAESLQTMIADTVFIHVKDTSGSLEKFRFLLPGEGNIDYAAYSKLLQTAKYSGAVVVEVSGQVHSQPGYDPIAAAKQSYAALAAFRLEA